jgi:hypothetical protein
MAVLVFVGLVAGSVVMFETPNDSRSVSGDPNLRDGIRVEVNVVKVIPETDHLIARMSFHPLGRYADGHFLAKPVRVIVVGGATNLDEKFDRGELIPPENVEIGLEGDIAQYPFDSYDGMFEVSFRNPDGTGVPSVLVADASVHGYFLTATDPESELDGGNDMTIDVSRSKANLIFGFFVIGLMWALTALAIVRAIGEIRSSRPVDTPVISFLGVLLFAFPSIRNSMPNAPPLGVLSDFACYFWCEISLGLTLVVLLATHIRRRLAERALETAG